MAAAPVRGIVTPEAVVLDFETAGVVTRALAVVVDLFVRLLGLFVVSIVISAAAAVGGQTLAIVLAVPLFFALIFVYPVLLEVRWNGQTFGKRVLGLRVVTVEGAPCRIRHAAIRSMLAPIELVVVPVGVLAAVSIVATRRNQRLGDLFAGTLVLREATGARFPNPVSFPPLPGFEGYARTLDVGSVTPGQYGVMRSFLIRVNELTPDARVHLARRLADPIAVAMHHTPPPGVSPEAFLVCVAAAYQLRLGGPPVALPPWISPWGSPQWQWRAP